MQLPKSSPRKKIIGLIALLVFGGLLTILLPAHSLRPLQSVLVTVGSPFENLFSWIAFELRSLGDFVYSIRSLKEENERLHQTVLTLSGNEVLLTALQAENDELRKQALLEPRSKTTLLPSEVVARGDGGLSTTLRINRGEQDQVKIGMPVVAHGDMLIGRVIHVAPFSAEVRLLSHHESLVGAMVKDVSGQMIVRGDHGVGLLLDLARPTDVLVPGSLVMTSGLSDGLPPGLFIGSIQTVRSSPDQLFQQAVITPPIRADTLRFVSVMMAF